MSVIGKTRQSSSLPEREAPAAEDLFDPEVGRPRGVLMPPPVEGRMRHSRRRPPDDLADLVEHYWSVSWDLRGHEPFLQQTLPHPNVHVVFEQEKSGVSGVFKARFARKLEHDGRVFGIKFRPGGFHPFRESVGMLANRVVPIETIFGRDGSQWEPTMLSLSEDDTQIEAASRFLRARRPPPDANIDLAAQLVAQTLNDPRILTVDALARRSGMGVRSLQRLFREYVGTSPKWVIRLYRLHELVERLKAGELLDGAQAALDLGYFDQAHLINDFRSIVGYSPGHYRSLLRKAR